MSRFTKESLETLKSRIDLPEVLSQHIELKRAGAAFKALCPFHDEKSPSFVINRGDAHYHCFGCGAHGDAIQFLMQHVKLSFSDAVQQLAERFQVQLETLESNPDAKRVNRSRLKEALETACRFYQTYLLHTEEGRVGIDYLYKRDLDLGFIHTFRVGLSPKLEGIFRKFMHQSGFGDEELEEAGLLAKRGERYRDFFQERIMFPILDAQGSVIGFSARKYKEGTYGGKYINTSETPLFKKSRVLFGLASSRRRIVKQKQAIIVEGGLDATRMIYHGFDLTVAALGTAFGEDHAHELIHLGVQKVFLLFDGDNAGQEAAVKVGHMFQKKGVEVNVATLGDGQDPDSLLVKDGPVAITQAIIEAKDYLSFLVAHFTKRLTGNSPAEKNQMIQELVQRIREWDNAVMVHESLKRLSALTQVPEDILGVGGVQPRSIIFKRSVANAATQNIDPDRILEGDLLRWLILCGPSVSDLISLSTANIQDADFRVPVAQKVYASVIQTLSEKRELDLLQLTADIDAEEMPLFLSEILSKKVNRDRAREQFVETLLRIKERNWMHEREQVKMKIHSGKATDDELMQLVKQFDELKKSPPKVVTVLHPAQN